MTDVTVTCGCGRKMTQRGNDPKGTYRCGCGARVHLQLAERPACMGITEEGGRCRLVPLREAAPWGLLLCEGHFTAFMATLEELRAADREHVRLSISVNESMELGRKFRAEVRAQEAAQAELYAEQAVVYYIRIGDCIKIGTTRNMKARMTGLMPDEILATEPGGRELEKMRHEQFAGLKVRGERFVRDPELLSHIQMIREHYGEPKMTGYLRS